jgi:two-component sensor histidine kinase
VAIVPVLLAVAYNEFDLRQAREREIRSQALATAQQTSYELERLVAGTEAVLDAIAATPSVAAGDWASCENFLAAFKQKLPQFISLGVLDSSGRPVCRSDRVRSAISFADRPYFTDAVKAPNTLIVADYTVSRVRNVPTLPMTMAFTDADGRVTGVATAVLDLAWFGTMIRERQLPPGGSITIADRNGTIIAREPLPERFVGTRIPDQYQSLVRAPAPGTIEVLSQDGTRRFLGYIPATTPPVGLYISVGLATREAFALIDAATQRTGTIILAAVAIAVLIATLLVRALIERPIRQIGETITGRRTGNHAARTRLQPGRGELEDLGVALDRYADELDDALQRRDAAERQRELLSHELAHRIKNMLATVQAVARQTFSRGGNLPDLVEVFEGRLRSIADAQALLLAEDAAAVSLDKAVESATRPFEPKPGERFALEGPAIPLNPKAALSIAMAFHELATNAVKYGALSTATGRVRIAWAVAGDVLTLTWREVGGPPVEAPSRTGFGSRMIEQMLAASLSGTVAIDYRPQGVECTIVASVAALAPEPPGREFFGLGG